MLPERECKLHTVPYKLDTHQYARVKVENGHCTSYVELLFSTFASPLEDLSAEVTALSVPFGYGVHWFSKNPLTSVYQHLGDIAVFLSPKHPSHHHLSGCKFLKGSNYLLYIKKRNPNYPLDPGSWSNSSIQFQALQLKL